MHLDSFSSIGVANSLALSFLFVRTIATGFYYLPYFDRQGWIVIAKAIIYSWLLDD